MRISDWSSDVCSSDLVNRCRALFATHYHELTSLAAKLDSLACHTMRVKEWQGDVVFLHEVTAGAADRSYGIHVARLAGLPKAAIVRAEAVLASLEQGEQAGALTRLAARSEERRVGTEWVSKCRSWCSPYH